MTGLCRITVVGGDQLTRQGCLYILRDLGRIETIDIDTEPGRPETGRPGTERPEIECTADALIASKPDWVIHIGWHPATPALCARLLDNWDRPPPFLLLGSTADDIDDAAMREALRLQFRAILLATPSDLDALRRLIASGHDDCASPTVRLSRPLAHRLAAIAPEPSAAPRQRGEAVEDRNIEIMRLLAEGKSNKEIAMHLDRSEALVKLRVKEIMRALGMRNRTQVAAHYLRHGANGAPAAKRTGD